MLRENAMKKYFFEHIDLEKYNVERLWNKNDKGNGYHITVFEETIKYDGIALDVVFEEDGWNINICIRERGFSEGYKANIENRLRNAGFKLIENPRTIYKDNIHLNLFELPADATYEEITKKVVSILDVLFKD